MINVENMIRTNASPLCNALVALYNEIEAIQAFDYFSIFVIGTDGLFRRERKGIGRVFLNDKYTINKTEQANALMDWFQDPKHCRSLYGNNHHKTFVLPVFCPSCKAFHLYTAGLLILQGNLRVDVRTMDMRSHAGMTVSSSHVEEIKKVYGKTTYWDRFADFLAPLIQWMDGQTPMNLKKTKRSAPETMEAHRPSPPPAQRWMVEEIELSTVVLALHSWKMVEVEEPFDETTSWEEMVHEQEQQQVVDELEEEQSMMQEEQQPEDVQQNMMQEEQQQQQMENEQEEPQQPMMQEEQQQEGFGMELTDEYEYEEPLPPPGSSENEVHYDPRFCVQNDGHGMPFFIGEFTMNMMEQLHQENQEQLLHNNHAFYNAPLIGEEGEEEYPYFN